MPRAKHRLNEISPPREPPDDKSGARELRRLSEASEAQWQNWAQDGVETAESECLLLTEMVYALSDLHTRAKEMRLDFLGYLLGMALQEALIELRPKALHDHAMPPTK